MGVMLIVYFVLGCFVGGGVASIVIGLYGDPELNNKVRELREQRYNLALAKYNFKKATAYYTLSKFFRKIGTSTSKRRS